MVTASTDPGEGAPAKAPPPGRAARPMRRRLTRAMVALTVGAVLLAGLSALVLTVRTTRHDTEVELRREAVGLALGLEARQPVGGAIKLAGIERLLREVKAPLRLGGVAIYALRAGRLYPPTHTTVPGIPARRVSHLVDGLPVSAVDLGALVAGATVSGERGPLVYAASPFVLDLRAGPRRLVYRGVVVLTRVTPSGVDGAVPWLLVVSVVVVAVAVVVADRLSRRILRPLASTTAVATRLAAGELSARVELPADTDDELGELGAVVNRMATDLAAARAAQRQFLLAVSHDLRTPLTSIRGYAEALEDGTASDPAAAGAVISAESRRLERLVGDLLELGRVELRQFPLRLEVIDPAGAARSAVAAFAPTAAGYGVRLALDVRGAEPVLADPDRVAQVLANLVENALDYATSIVTVGVEATALSVDDDGPGIEAALLGRVFEPAVGSMGRRARRVGTGLGLAIVDELVRAMGGTVGVVSPLGPSGGTRVRVTLPAAGSVAVPPAQPAAGETGTRRRAR